MCDPKLSNRPLHSGRGGRHAKKTTLRSSTVNPHTTKVSRAWKYPQAILYSSDVVVERRYAAEASSPNACQV